ncbi:hypothetical protein J437_LFUL005274 [Ladona fulva]|uniref:CCHC-type domain-containing protein n=1 Tax=Ladona fulva TaxID=123851 RepID=A0A8K0P7N1_LADFU|nr:hypothetical protein J437_LFUL005274 [Ladona fulva]
MSPFLIHRVLSGSVLGKLKSAEKLRDGTLLVETNDETQSEALLKMTNIQDTPIKVEPHKTLNTCRGVISCYDLMYITADEIAKEMASQGVISCRRLQRKQTGEMVNTTSVVLTFAWDRLPEKVYVGYEVCTVRPYIPSPIRCFKCNRHGHTANSCKAKPTCPKCAGDMYDGEPCNGPPKCINCEGCLPVYTRECPRLQEEKKITEIKVIEKVSYADARKKYREKVSPTFSRSYAAVTTIKRCSVSCQTDPWIEKAKNAKEKAKSIEKKLTNSIGARKMSKYLPPAS